MVLQKGLGFAWRRRWNASAAFNRWCHSIFDCWFRIILVYIDREFHRGGTTPTNITIKRQGLFWDEFGNCVSLYHFWNRKGKKKKRKLNDMVSWIRMVHLDRQTCLEIISSFFWPTKVKEGTNREGQKSSHFLTLYTRCIMVAVFCYFSINVS